MAESSTGSQPDAGYVPPEIEGRRQTSDRATEPGKDVPQVYLVERQAIRLRRLRWTQAVERESAGASFGAAATAPQGSAGAGVVEDDLIDYTRPLDQRRSHGMADRARRWVRSIFSDGSR